MLQKLINLGFSKGKGNGSLLSLYKRRLFLPQKALNAMAAASPTALLTKTQGQKQLYYLLYQPVTAPLLRMNLRQQVALHLGAILLNLPDIYAPGAQGQLLTFARHLLCPQHLLTSLKGHYSFDALWQLVMAPKSLCFDALVDCPRQLA